MATRPQPEQGDVWEEMSFLAAPGRVADWRMVLLFDTAVEAGILDGLPATATELAARHGIQPQAVRVVLEALAPWEVVTFDGARFSLGPRAPGSEEADVLRHHARSLRLWTERLPDSLAATTPPPPVRSPLARWLDALAVNARSSAPAAVDACLRRSPGARNVLDLGGGHGAYALEFARRGLHATMQDRPEVIGLARQDGVLEAAGIRLHAGDFFETLPSGSFDIVFCAGVSYTYDGDRNRELFQRAAAAISPGGVLAIHTFLRGRDPRAAIFAVQMLGVAGGDTHSEEDHRRWLSSVGFGRVDVVHLQRPPESMLFATS